MTQMVILFFLSFAANGFAYVVLMGMKLKLIHAKQRYEFMVNDYEKRLRDIKAHKQCESCEEWSKF